MSALDEIYQEKLLAYAADIARTGRLANPDATAKSVSRSCGSSILVDVKLADGVIVDYSQQVKACALGSASASIFAGIIIGKTAAEVGRVRDRMVGMLEDGGPAPDGEWEEFALLAPAAAFANRHQSILLPFTATLAALAGGPESKGAESKVLDQGGGG